MTFHVLTIFPELVRAVFEYGVVGRAVEAGLLGYEVHDLRDYAGDKHRSTDDEPFGGGPGMVMLAGPIFAAVESIRAKCEESLPLVYLTPAGERFDHGIACELARGGDFILLCGRYEGVDQRVLEHLVDREISIGDFVLSGGEVAAMAVIDAVARQIPGVVGNEVSLDDESFAKGLLDWPHYTRPETFRDWRAPEVLLSGHHANIARWREEQALLLTYKRRPDLLNNKQLEQAKQLLGHNNDE
ncbi:tRNA (guanosine(37)-N1)-methyltransferase TrmD [bacterium]|nr:tRNA (guanosine(37)-N1)-methyltransferase TrmD [bacterium]